MTKNVARICDTQKQFVGCEKIVVHLSGWSKAEAGGGFWPIARFDR
jgi:hypothetical protein